MHGRLPHWIVIVLAAGPAVGLATEFAINGPGANPIEEITHLTGRWGLRLILLSLAVTPARRWFGWRQIAPLRRTLGLAGFSYACLHVSTWALLDHGLDAARRSPHAVSMSLVDGNSVWVGGWRRLRRVLRIGHRLERVRSIEHLAHVVEPLAGMAGCQRNCNDESAQPQKNGGVSHRRQDAGHSPTIALAWCFRR